MAGKVKQPYQMNLSQMWSGENKNHQNQHKQICEWADVDWFPKVCDYIENNQPERQ